MGSKNKTKANSKTNKKIKKSTHIKVPQNESDNEVISQDEQDLQFLEESKDYVSFLSRISETDISR